VGTRRGIPEATVARLPVYHRVLTSLNEVGVATVSSEELANASGVSSAKLRKDLSHLGSYGTRSVTTWSSSSTKSPASLVSLRIGPSSSLVSATWAGRWRTTGDSRHAASGSSASLMRTRILSART
jgi:hypothetical protein